MRYVALFLLLVVVGVTLRSIPKEEWAPLRGVLRTYLPILLFSLAAVLAAVFIAYFGGHIRVL